MMKNDEKQILDFWNSPLRARLPEAEGGVDLGGMKDGV